MKKIFLMQILLLVALQLSADSFLLKAEKGIEAKIDEDTFGKDGYMNIFNRGDEVVALLLLKKKPDPDAMGPLILKQFQKVTINPGEKKIIRISDTKNTIYGIGVINKSTDKPYEIHGFKWPK